MPVTEAPNRVPEGHAVSRPRLGLADVLVLLWRAKWLMLLVFLPVFALGLAAALSVPTKYEARSRLLVSAGETADTATLMQSELAVLRSPVVAARALDRFPMSRIYPEINAACEEKSHALFGDAEGLRQLAYECRQLCVLALQKDFRAQGLRDTPVLMTAYRHEDAGVSAEILNALIGAYLNYRSDILPEAGPAETASQPEQASPDLPAAEAAIGAFLEAQGLSDFEAERETLQQLYQAASIELLATASRMRQVEGQIAAYRSQLKSIRRDQRIFVEDTTGQALLDLRLERAGLLASNPPGAPAIQAIDRRIALAESLIGSLDGPAGTVRTGPNPLYEETQSALNRLQAEAASLIGQRAELVSQIAGFEARQKRLTALAPRYEALLRTRDRLAEAAPGRIADIGQARRPADSVRVIEPATPPVRPSGLAWPLAALALLVAALSALTVGLLKAFTRSGFATGGSVERTLGLPVLANVREY